MARYTGDIPLDTPRIYFTGIKDSSKRKIPAGKPNIPIASSLVFLFTEMGPDKPQFMAPSDAIAIYGSKSFEPGSKFETSQTKLFNILSQVGSSCTIQRLVPEDAKVKANISIWYDILHTDIPNYLRTASGTYDIDPETKQPRINPDKPTTKGFKVKIIAEQQDGINDLHEYGRLTRKPGTMRVQTLDKDGEPITKTSTMYPIMEVVAPYYGKRYNLTGFSIDTVKGRKLDRRFIKHNKSLLYEITFFEKEDEYSSPEVTRNLYDENSSRFMFKPKAESPIVKGSKITFDRAYPLKYVNTTDKRFKMVPPLFDKFYIYEQNIEAISRLIYIEELKQIYSQGVNDDGDMLFEWYDFNTQSLAALTKDKDVESEHFMMDFLNLKTLSDVPYKSFIHAKESAYLEPNQEEVSLTVKTPVFLKGGLDGTMTQETFEQAILKAMKVYLDTDHPIQNLNTNLTNSIWDTGFSLEVKLALCNYLTVKPDSIVWFGTHIDGANLSISEQIDVAGALVARLNLFPESTIHNTKVCRGILMLGNAVFVGDTDLTNRKSIVYEMAYKVHKMMGSSQVKYIYGEKFDGGSGAELKIMYDYQPGEMRESIKDRLWGNTLNWAEYKSNNGTYAFPAIQTVYGDETSSLRNVYMLYAVAFLSRVATYVHNEHKGISSMSPNMLKASIDTMTENMIGNAFSGIVKVTHECFFEEIDKIKGNTYRQAFRIAGSNVWTTSIVEMGAFRLTESGEIEDAPSEENPNQ